MGVREDLAAGGRNVRTARTPAGTVTGGLPGPAAAGPWSRSVLTWAGAIVMALAAALIAWEATSRFDSVASISASLPVFTGLLVLGVLGDVLRELSRDDEVELSFTAVILLGAIPLAGPVLAVCCGPLIMVFSPLLSRVWRGARGVTQLPSRTPVLFAVNAAMSAFLTAAGSYVYSAAGGVRVGAAAFDPAQLTLLVGLPLLLADLTIAALNSVLVGSMIALAAGPLRAFITGALPISVALYLGYGVTAFLFVVLWGPVGVGPLALVLILAPLLMSRWSYLEYVEERLTHGRLLGALAVAGEVRRGNVDRSSRIGVLCEAMEAGLGLTARERAILRRASALHDVGIVSVPWDVLDSDPEGLDDADLDRVEAHPRVSYEVLRGIDFLEGSAEAVLHHHERFDGLGYPDGLSGETIPLASRVLAVVDVAEAVGRTAPAGQAGIDQVTAALKAESGTMLDPRIVSVLVGLLESPSGPALFEGFARVSDRTSPVGHSHALPRMSHVLAARIARRRVR